MNAITLARFARQTFGLLAGSCLYYGLARFGMAVFSIQPANITLLWLPSGIALLMSIRWGIRAWPFVTAASFAANLPGMLTVAGPWPYIYCGICASADGFAGIMAAYLLNRKLPNGLERIQDLLPFCLWICVSTTTITGLILSTVLVKGGYIPPETFGSLVLRLILADGLGILLVFQIYQGWRNNPRLSRPELLWLAGYTVITGILLFVGFSVMPGAVFFVIPLLLILSFNVGLLGVGAASSLTMIGIIAATAQNRGPFVAADPVDSNFRMMSFVFASALTILGMALQNSQLVFTEHARKLWQEAAHRDHLTGLINRRGFAPRLQEIHDRARRLGSTYALAILDLDHFKQINDTYGHLRGDDVLCALAAVIADNCRAVDSIARLGGEEFAVLLPDYSASEAGVLLERVRNQLESRPVATGGELIPVTVSVGVTSSGHLNEEDSHVVARADKALYAAKAGGRNRVIVDEPAAA